MTGRRLAAVALAVRLLAVDHQGQLPATLDGLVPTYLVAVPDDPFSGRPFRYIRDAKRPIVYSVGNDGIDDGGIEEDRRLGRTQYGFKGDIVVNLKLQPRKGELETPKTGPSSLDGSSQRGGCQVAAESVREQERTTAEASLVP
jgi:hypothetical protein